MARTANNDPLEKFRFLVDISFPGQTAAPTAADASTVGNPGKSFVTLGFHDVQMPKRTTNKINYREGHNADISSISAGLSTMEDVVMSRGVLVGDAAILNDFLSWASRVHIPTAGYLVLALVVRFPLLKDFLIIVEKLLLNY